MEVNHCDGQIGPTRQCVPVAIKPAVQVTTILGKAPTKPKHKLKDLEKSAFRAPQNNDFQLDFSGKLEFLTDGFIIPCLKCH